MTEPVGEHAPDDAPAPEPSTTPAGPAPRPVVRTASDRAMLRATILALAIGLLLDVVVIVVAASSFGTTALNGALVGTGLTLLVGLPTVLTTWAAPRLGPVAMAATMFGGWATKMLIVVIVIIALRGVEAISMAWIGIALLAGALVSVTAEMVLLGRIRRPLDVSHGTSGEQAS